MNNEIDNCSSISILKTYVWFESKCFFVSTIERESSSPLGSRYNETMVWEYDWSKGERGNILFQDGDSIRSIRLHQKVVERLYQTGKADDYPAKSL